MGAPAQEHQIKRGGAAPAQDDKKGEAGAVGAGLSDGPVGGRVGWGRDRTSLSLDFSYRAAVVVGPATPPSDVQATRSCASRLT